MKTLLSHRIAGLVRIAFWVALVTALTMAFLPKPPKLPIDSFGDKFEHMLAFFGLTVLAQIGFQQTPRWRIAERLSFVGAMIEVVQSIPILHRDCDIRDWMADTATIIVVTAILALGRALIVPERDATAAEKLTIS